MPAQLLAIDVGNSFFKFCLFDASEISDVQLPICRNPASVALDGDLPWSAVRACVGQNDAVQSVVAGANPRGIKKVIDTWPQNDWALPVVLERFDSSVLEVKLAAPEKVGIDRLLNAIAVNVVREKNRPAIIVSSGTATTVDYVDAGGAFAGGAILPGFELSARALHQYTALLPLISVDEIAGGDPGPLGIDTRHALQSGVFWGQLGAVRELIAQLSTLDSTESQVFLTGGGAKLLAPHLSTARFEPYLALQGLAIAFAHRMREKSDWTSGK